MVREQRLKAVTVHGRFQPPLHVNHWNYVKQGFERAKHVTILITNPGLNEAFDASASWRNDPAQNPFTYHDRVEMWTAFLSAMGIPQSRYTIRPFNIKDPLSFAELDPDVPNLVNIYSEWSAKKFEAFKEHKLIAIRLDQPKVRPVSGTSIRKIINDYQEDTSTLKEKLITEGFMPEAVPGLLAILSKRHIPIP